MKNFLLYFLFAFTASASAQSIDYHSRTPSDISILNSIEKPIRQHEGRSGYFQTQKGEQVFLGIIGRVAFVHGADSLAYVLLSESSDGNGYMQEIIRKHLILKKKGNQWILIDSLSDHSAYGEGSPQFIHAYGEWLMIESERAYSSEGGEDFEFRDYLILKDDGFLPDAQLSVMTYYDDFSSPSCMDEAGEYLFNCDCNNRYMDVWPFWVKEEGILFFMVDGETQRQYGDACNVSSGFKEKTIYGFTGDGIIEVWHSRVPDFEGEASPPKDEALIRLYRNIMEEAGKD